ncbi:9798_t:CDS:2, partial [Dentiscutata heterogama]
VGMWIQLASCYYIIIDTDPSIFGLLNNKPCLFKAAIFFFIMTTAQVQDMRDQEEWAMSVEHIILEIANLVGIGIE